jgi:hypothetical protein
MLTTSIELSEDAFDALFPLIPNHLDPAAGWALGEGRGCLFETYGDELEFVRRQNPRAIWTLLDGDDGMCVTSGFHRVNRIGYLVSSVLVPEGVDIEVPLPEQGEATASGEAEANVRLMTAAPQMLEALRLAQSALNTAPRFRVGDTDSYQIAAIVDRAVLDAIPADARIVSYDTNHRPR